MRLLINDPSFFPVQYCCCQQVLAFPFWDLHPLLDRLKRHESTCLPVMNKAGDVTAQRLTWRATSAQTTYRSAGTRGILPRSSAAAPAEVSDRKAACSAAGSAWRQHPSRSLWQLYNNGCGQRQTSVLLCFDKMLTDVQVHVCSKVPGRPSHLSGKNQTSMNVQLVLVGFSLVHFTF